MAYSPPYHYQWQNPELSKVIYPFRLEKLRHFLVYYQEIDLWKANQNAPVDSKVEFEIVQEIARLDSLVKEAKKALEAAKVELKELERKNQAFLRNRPILLLEQKKLTLKASLAKQTTIIRSLTDSVTWYQNYAKTHPEVLQNVMYKRREADLQEATEAYQAIANEIDLVNVAIGEELEKAGLGGFENQREQLKKKIEDLTGQITRLNEGIARLPPLGKNGEVTSGTAVRWEVLKYDRSLEDKDQGQLIEEILARFAAEPTRFPKWLQYMILHFSGMRYKSAHGSWASPIDLLEMVKIEEYEKWARAAKPEELDRECALAIQAYEQRKTQLTRPQDRERIDWQMVALKDRYNRQTALIRFHTARISQEVRSMKDEQALVEIKNLKDIFPPWVWKEIASRSELRLETTDEHWETLTSAEVQERWDWKNRYWREIMDLWEGKDITGWRKQHEMTLSLVVTRAVCNEIAEHIQHLRGVTPAAGLTAKPSWYLKMQKAALKAPAVPKPQNADFPYLITPDQHKKEDFKPGASILWLGWVTQRPNQWQICHPLEGIKTLPPRDVWTPYDWSYREENGEYIREANTADRPQAAGKKRPRRRRADGQQLKNWLRWTHEAIVVEVAEMAGGVEYVLTFETGQIGLRLRPLRELLHNPYVYIGYMPPADKEPENLPKMLARETLLPAPTIAVPREIAFEVPGALTPLPELVVEEPLEEKRWLIWNSLSRREKQVATLICSGKSTDEIASRLGITRSTVKKHLQGVMRKFDVHSRVELKQVVADLRSAP